MLFQLWIVEDLLCKHHKSVPENTLFKNNFDIFLKIHFYKTILIFSWKYVFLKQFWYFPENTFFLKQCWCFSFECIWFPPSWENWKSMVIGSQQAIGQKSAQKESRIVLMEFRHCPNPQTELRRSKSLIENLVFVAKPPRAMIKELRIHFFSTPSRRFRTARNLKLFG